MIFQNNREGRIKGSKGRIPGGVAIILSPAAVEAWREAGLKSPITTPRDSPFVGRFIGVKLRFPLLDPYERKL